MYNDYYLEQINNKMNSIEDIINNQEIIITNQEIMISGDNAILESQQRTEVATYTIALVIVMYVLFYYIVRCLK